eukprot:scaffold14208_cov88-Cylindrotheca_fusiformis.AAC.1
MQDARFMDICMRIFEKQWKFRQNSRQIPLLRKVGEVGTEKWGVDTVDSRFAQRIAPHDTHDDVSSLARDERELSNGHAGGDVATVAHFSCRPTTVTDSFS